MPAKNTLKTYVENGYYHLYNRGVEKRIIFKDQKDYSTFLHLLKNYLTQNPLSPFSKRTLYGRIELLAFCLMPNHFHLLVKQFDKNAMADFMRRLCTAYSMYFNHKYKRTGTLFESRYKASLIDQNELLLHLSRYLHQNPANLLKRGRKLNDYWYSSYPHYLGSVEQDWLKTGEILSLLKEEFGKRITYQKFMEDNSMKSPLLAYENYTLEENA